MVFYICTRNTGQYGQNTRLLVCTNCVPEILELVSANIVPALYATDEHNFETIRTICG